MGYFLIWIAIALLTSKVAADKGNDAVGGFILGLFLGPLGLVIAFVVDYLKDKSKNGDARSSCLLADYYRNINQPDIALDFANNGKKSNDKRISEWCSFVERSVEVIKIYSK